MFDTGFQWTVVGTNHTGVCTMCNEFCKYIQAGFEPYQVKQLTKC